MKRGFIRAINKLFKGVNNLIKGAHETKDRLEGEVGKISASPQAIEIDDMSDLNTAGPSRQAQYSVYQSLWLFELASQAKNVLMTPVQGDNKMKSLLSLSPVTQTFCRESFADNPEETSPSADRASLKENFDAQDSTQENLDFSFLSTGLTYEETNEFTKNLMSFIFSELSKLADEFNRLIVDVPELADIRISTTNVSEVKESLAGLDTDGKPRAVSYYRCRLASSVFSLSMRGKTGQIEFYLVPANELLSLSLSEKPPRRKAIVHLHKRYSGVWTIDRLPIDNEELLYLIKDLFKKLVVTSYEAVNAERNGKEFKKQDSVNTTLSRLLSATQNMAQKIVSQQEEIQYRIARDLHDAVMADIMMLKRSLTGDKTLSADEIVETLDNVSERLREVCHDLAPRDLKDWGLRTVIEDLVGRIGNRTGIDCSVICPHELPELPHPVQLHIYRIVQESLSNIEKYAAATKMTVSIEITAASIRIIIDENGRGFSMPDIEARKLREGGTGLSSINERAAMIQCFYPTQLKIDSQPEHGSRTVLQIKLSGL